MAQRSVAPAEGRSGLTLPTSRKLLVRRGDVLACFGVDAHDAVVGEYPRLAVGPLVLAAHRATQAPIQVGVRLLEVTDDLEVDPLHLRQVNLLDVHEPEQLADRLGHLAPAF